MLLPQAPNQEALCYKDRYDEWEKDLSCKIITSTRDSFQDMFDDDNTLAYEPESTAAIILTGGDEESEAAALEVRPSGNYRHALVDLSMQSHRLACSGEFKGARLHVT